MLEIRPLEKDDIPAYARGWTAAYPGLEINTPEKMAARIKSFETGLVSGLSARWYAVLSDDKVVGGFRVHPFEMNFRGATVPVQGIGAIFVDMAHKRQGVARQIMLFFEAHCREQKVPISLLYPFHPRFYKKLGYGESMRMYDYMLAPSSFMPSPLSVQVRRAVESDAPRLAHLYDRLQQDRHGLLVRSSQYWEAALLNPASQIFVFEDGTDLHGYLSGSFQRGATGNFLINDLQITEWMYETRAAFSAMSGFLFNQQDQLRNIRLLTPDPEFFHLIADPLRKGGDMVHPVCQHSHSVALGMMAKILDPQWVIASISGDNARQCAAPITLRITDPLANTSEAFDLPAASSDGPRQDVAVSSAVFASLAMTGLSSSNLLLNPEASVPSPAVARDLAEFFASPAPPVCLTVF